MFGEVRNKREDEQRMEESHHKANVGGKGWKRTVKCCCGLYLEALGEARVHVIRTASRAEGREEGEGEEEREVRSGGVLHRTREREERLNHRDRELERNRFSVQDMVS
ncbi:hypothetical protein INR49_003108 [Caranx melampygus]|nr:hypothetical protein INR49_003108 [Caranx melampygus]